MMPNMRRRAWSNFVDSPPTNAWLLVGDEASRPGDDELSDFRRSWRAAETLWTSPKQVQPGDLLFFYFISPIKAVHFAARAASYPFFDSSITVNAYKKVSDHQWWVRYTPMVPVEPVTYAQLQAITDGHLILRGRPVHYLPPAAAARIMSKTAKGRLTPIDAAVLQKPVGDPRFPSPSRMGLPRWRSLSEGPLKLERQVEEYIVEPLLRLALTGIPGISWRRAVRLAGGVPDYVVYSRDQPTCAVEVKVGVREVPGRRTWTASPDFQQVRRYASELAVPAALIDSNRIFLFAAGGREPRQIVRRQDCTPSELKDIGRHLSGC